jgi:hypothetical protein
MTSAVVIAVVLVIPSVLLGSRVVQWISLRSVTIIVVELTHAMLLPSQSIRLLVATLVPKSGSYMRLVVQDWITPFMLAGTQLLKFIAVPCPVLHTISFLGIVVGDIGLAVIEAGLRFELQITKRKNVSSKAAATSCEDFLLPPLSPI